MEEATDVLGNPLTLLIERIFWLGLGCFFGLALITSFLRGLNYSKDKKKLFSPEDVENLSKKGNQQISDSN